MSEKVEESFNLDIIMSVNDLCEIDFVNNLAPEDHDKVMSYRLL